MHSVVTTVYAHKNSLTFFVYVLDGSQFLATFIFVMTSSSSLALLRNALALRKKKKALLLRLALIVICPWI